MKSMTGYGRAEIRLPNHTGIKYRDFHLSTRKDLSSYFTAPKNGNSLKKRARNHTEPAQG